MRCAREILVERENKLNELITAKKTSLVESTIRFCEEYVGPILEERFGDLTYSPKREICITPNRACRFIYFDRLTYYVYNNYSFDYDILKTYLNNRCFKVEKVIFAGDSFYFRVTIDPKCFEVE